MKLTTTILSAALVFVGFAAMTPAVGALDVGCQRLNEVSTLPGGTSTLFTPPGADVLGWTPECVIIGNGETITFTQRDVIGHGVVTDCFELGVMRAGTSTTLNLDYVAEFGVVITELNGEPGTCANLGVVGDGTLTIDYWCEVHGKGMPGKIIVEI